MAHHHVYNTQIHTHSDIYTKQYRRRSSQTIGRGQTKRNTLVYTYTQHTEVAATAAMAAVAEREKAHARALMLKRIFWKQNLTLNLSLFLAFFFGIYILCTVAMRQLLALFLAFLSVYFVSACVHAYACLCMCGRPTIVGIWWAVYHFVSVRTWWCVCVCYGNIEKQSWKKKTIRLRQRRRWQQQYKN